MCAHGMQLTSLVGEEEERKANKGSSTFANFCDKGSTIKCIVMQVLPAVPSIISTFRFLCSLA